MNLKGGPRGKYRGYDLKPLLKIGHVLLHKLPDNPICKKFGCGKHLTRSEYLASDYCTEHSHEIQMKNAKNIFQ